MSEFWKAVLLGAIQGATEFLPISSSGHLIAAKTIAGYQAPLAFDVVLHLPTLLAVLIYFGRDLARLAFSPERWGVALRIALGTIPAAAIAFSFRKWREGISPWWVVVGWSLSGTYLLLTRGRRGERTYPGLPVPRAILVGAAQGIAAVIPGFSRSGSSIASGLWMGLRRDEAFRFSFHLALPIMLGALLVEGRKVSGADGLDLPGGWPALLGSCAAALVVGLLAIHVLRKVVIGNGFHRFGWYNLAAAGAFAIYLSRG